LRCVIDGTLEPTGAENETADESNPHKEAGGDEIGAVDLWVCGSGKSDVFAVVAEPGSVVSPIL
jgi:hypothetical protein